MASILVVDDSISMRQMPAIIRRNAGHQVTAVEDGADVLEIAHEKTSAW